MPSRNSGGTSGNADNADFDLAVSTFLTAVAEVVEGGRKASAEEGDNSSSAAAAATDMARRNAMRRVAMVSDLLLLVAGENADIFFTARSTYVRFHVGTIHRSSATAQQQSTVSPSIPPARRP
jgi:hypothetical protein